MGIITALAGLFQVVHDGFTLAMSLRKTPAEQRNLLIFSIHAAIEKAEKGDTSALETIIRS